VKLGILYGETFFLLIGRGVLSVEGYRMVYRSVGVQDPMPSLTASLPTAIRDVSLEKLQAECIVMPLMRAAAVPEVAVTSRRFEIPLFVKSFTCASMTRDFPVPPSPPTNWHS
jgi:hypothetical protein